METKLHAAGFDIVFSTSFMSLLLPAIWLSRVLSGHSRDGTGAGVEREFQVSSLFNQVLIIILTAETMLTKRGVSWPVGSSRVVVARKR
jgi:hypothetical protein